jgi:hypothetical protein
MSIKRLIVISERGVLVGTQIPLQEAGNPPTTKASLFAGPNQTMHEIDIEDPEQYHKARKLDELHRIVKERLKLK